VAGSNAAVMWAAVVMTSWWWGDMAGVEWGDGRLWGGLL
jgi:hypothetical protein